MASARIEAASVYRAAEAVIEQKQSDETAEVDAALRNLERTPQVLGVLWWKRTHYLTQAEAEAQFGRPRDDEYPDLFPSARREIEQHFRRQINKAARLRDLAKAALSRTNVRPDIGAGVGDGYVSLDADEVRFLGLQDATA